MVVLRRPAPAYSERRSQLTWNQLSKFVSRNLATAGRGAGSHLWRRQIYGFSAALRFRLMTAFNTATAPFEMDVEW